MEKDYYQILVVHPTASQREINEAAERLLAFWNSRTNVDPTKQSEMILDIRKAWNVLKNPVKRLEYDIKQGYRKSSKIQASIKPVDSLLGVKYSESLEVLSTVRIPREFDYNKIEKSIATMEKVSPDDVLDVGNVPAISVRPMNIPLSQRSLNSIGKREELINYPETNDSEEYVTAREAFSDDTRRVFSPTKLGPKSESIDILRGSKVIENKQEQDTKTEKSNEYTEFKDLGHTQIVNIPDTLISNHKLVTESTVPYAESEKMHAENISSLPLNELSKDEKWKPSRSLEVSPKLQSQEISQIGLREKNFHVNGGEEKSLLKLSKELVIAEQKITTVDSGKCYSTAVSTDTQESSSPAAYAHDSRKLIILDPKAKLSRIKSFSVDKSQEFFRLTPEPITTYERKFEERTTEVQEHEPSNVDTQCIIDTSLENKKRSSNIAVKHVDSFELITKTLRRTKTDPDVFKSQQQRFRPRSLSCDKDAERSFVPDKFHEDLKISMPKDVSQTYASKPYKESRRTSFSDELEVIDLKIEDTSSDDDILKDTTNEYFKDNGSKFLEEIQSLVKYFKQSVPSSDTKCTCNEKNKKDQELASKNKEYEIQTLPISKAHDYDKKGTDFRPGRAENFVNETKLNFNQDQTSITSKSRNNPLKEEKRNFQLLPDSSKSPNIEWLSIETKTFISKSSDFIISQTDKSSVGGKIKEFPKEMTARNKRENGGFSLGSSSECSLRAKSDTAERYFMPQMSLEVVGTGSDDQRSKADVSSDHSRLETSVADSITIQTQKFDSNDSRYSVQVSGKQEQLSSQSAENDEDSR